MSNEDPRWLDPTQQNAWRALVSVITRLPAALDTQMQRDSDMTHFEYFVLALLSEHPERRLRLNALAAEANASLSRLSHVVTRLEKRGWVRREPVPGSRGSYAVLTETGYDTVAEAAPTHVDAVRRLVFDGLDDQQVRALARLGSALVEQIDEGIAGGIGKA
ncbi:MarR family transcriptional regulator [Rhodococcus gordoniae]|uniref:MarR family transcriptional regulator n=1 Tax=Rhodococcus gordoniae TaxID=223392 RepID=A0A379LYW2_9NOCA|nr:MarR family transcriptional regulator [Rhodococcus gordoniae]SUE14335.1 MarR family transcriptional regulator [Rhodococcus gordoniae]